MKQKENENNSLRNECEKLHAENEEKENLVNN